MAVAFVISVLHSCSLNNNILTPDCKIFESLLVDRWWHSENDRERKIFFSSNGRMLIAGSQDSITYRIHSCNKISVSNHTAAFHETMELSKLLPDKAVFIEDGRVSNFLPNPQ